MRVLQMTRINSGCRALFERVEAWQLANWAMATCHPSSRLLPTSITV